MYVKFLRNLMESGKFLKRIHILHKLLGTKND
jgi:hypothetical protein